MSIYNYLTKQERAMVQCYYEKVGVSHRPGQRWSDHITAARTFWNTQPDHVKATFLNRSDDIVPLERTAKVFRDCATTAALCASGQAAWSPPQAVFSQLAADESKSNYLRYIARLILRLTDDLSSFAWAEDPRDIPQQYEDLVDIFSDYAIDAMRGRNVWAQQKRIPA